MGKSCSVFMLLALFVVLQGLIDSSRGSTGNDLAIKQSIENEAGTTASQQFPEHFVHISRIYTPVVLSGYPMWVVKSADSWRDRLI